MADRHFDQFLQESTIHELDSDSKLERDQLYGLYTSWCCVTGELPVREAAFWAAMKSRLVSRHNNGLRMKGAAAADYILSSYPVLV
ncbi:hypothetical protein [Arthrobacter sp. NPDC058192]|uniref:hypothetical protein n=1 Tax=Arthrobacter sp. NPDC058192 TaxID=3346372 RepID=UPI0036DFAFB8